MARGFGSTYGAGTDRILTTFGGPAQTKASISAWFTFHGPGHNNFGNLWRSPAHNLYANNSSTQFGFAAAFSGGSNVWLFSTAAGTTAWQHLLLAYDASSPANDPVAYINGSAVAMSSYSRASGTFVPGFSGNDFAIGNSYANTNLTWDGKIAEVALWNGVVLNASEAAALAKGVSPLFMRPSALALYYPLTGLGSGEPDWGPSRFGATLTGTRFQPHAPAGLWRPSVPMGAPACFAGSLALTAPAATAQLYGHGPVAAVPGAVSLGDAAQGGLLGLGDAGAALALADAALYGLQITETAP
ncbi:MAG TPA: hypothetical protein VMV79_04765 [Alphaproteobacteria bacterium]|nr:hypothetical protein [Alphaproteobacteria bacterium]